VARLVFRGISPIPEDPEATNVAVANDGVEGSFELPLQPRAAHTDQRRQPVWTLQFRPMLEIASAFQRSTEGRKTGEIHPGIVTPDFRLL
jgi:hypothetical protein